MELLLIRHGHPERLEVEDGPADPPLDERGHTEAEALARWLRDEKIDALYTSPLRRALETAAPLASSLGLQATEVDGIAEWDRDANVYLPTEDLRSLAPDVWDALTGNDWAALGIDLPAFLQRVMAALDQITASHPGERVAAVCHGGVVNAYVARALGLDRVLFFDPGYTSISRVLVSRAGVQSIASLNEVAHLRAMVA